MDRPPRDERGDVLPHDDPVTIPDDVELLRSLHPDHVRWSSDGSLIAKSGGFSGTNRNRDKYEGMSVSVIDWLKRDGRDPRDHLLPRHAAGAVLRTGDLRSLGLRVGPDPQDEDPYHAAVWDVKDRHRKKIRQRVIRMVIRMVAPRGQ